MESTLHVLCDKKVTEIDSLLPQEMKQRVQAAVVP